MLDESGLAWSTIRRGQTAGAATRARVPAHLALSMRKLASVTPGERIQGNKERRFERLFGISPFGSVVGGKALGVLEEQLAH